MSIVHSTRPSRCFKDGRLPGDNISAISEPNHDRFGIKLKREIKPKRETELMYAWFISTAVAYLPFISMCFELKTRLKSVRVSSSHSHTYIQFSFMH